MIALHSFVKRFHAIFFYFRVIFCHLDPLAEIANLFAGNVFLIDSKIFMSSGDKPVLTLKASFINVFRFQYFADFDINFFFLAKLVSSEHPSVNLSILYFKGYLRCKTITSQNVSSEAQVKNFFIS